MIGPIRGTCSVFPNRLWGQGQNELFTSLEVLEEHVER
jgi:hypothetical protein